MSGTKKQNKTPDSQHRIEVLRENIDAIDSEIQSLVNKRAAFALEIADVKRVIGQPFYVPEREAKILRVVSDRNQGPMPTENMVAIFREIISSTLALEQSTRIAVLGPAGSYTQEASIAHFGHATDAVFQTTIEEVFVAVELERAKYGVVPVENTTEGVVNSTLDCLLQNNVMICGEVNLEINHALLSNAQDLEEIRRVQGHPQALAQCRRWIQKHLPDAESVAVSSNSEAVMQAARDNTLGAIAAEVAGEIYHVAVMRTKIQDVIRNNTRFLVIGKTPVKPTGVDKTSIVMSHKHQAGSLFKLLEPFSRRSVNMTKIESRPTRTGTWEYVFFIDFEGHAEDPNIVALFEDLQNHSTLFRHLGSYPVSIF